MHAPSLWIERYLVGVKQGGKVLDVACGSGRHIRLAAALGHHVTGVDRDTTAARAAFGGDTRVELVTADLERGEPWPFPPATFDGVIVTNYLWRPILPDIVGAVADAGVLIYQTFRAGNERHGRPSRSDFLLQPAELIQAVSGKLVTVAYEDVTLPDPLRCVQRICAVGPRHPWIDEPLRSRDDRRNEEFTP